MKSPVLTSILVSCLVGMASSFALTTSQSQPWSTALPAKAGKTKKGFGTTPEPPAPKKKKPEPVMVESSSSSSPSSPAPPREEEEPNAGQKALQEMRRQRAEQKDAELRKVREMLQADEQLQQAPAAIPERVASRMGKRMLPFVGLPLVGGMGCFVVFWYLATYKDLEFQPALVAFSTIAILALGLVGITYSLMSASWDEDREGSFWGFDEFQRNVGNIKEGLQRSKENAVLRDKLNSSSEAEVAQALQDLERREKKSAAPKTLGEKLQQDGLD